MISMNAISRGFIKNYMIDLDRTATTDTLIGEMAFASPKEIDEVLLGIKREIAHVLIHILVFSEVYGIHDEDLDEEVIKIATKRNISTWWKRE